MRFCDRDLCNTLTWLHFSKGDLGQMHSESPRRRDNSAQMQANASTGGRVRTLLGAPSRQSRKGVMS